MLHNSSLHGQSFPLSLTSTHTFSPLPHSLNSLTLTLTHPLPPSAQCEDRTERDRLLQFIDKLLYHKQNVKLFLDTNGVKVLVDLVTLAHLHTQRAYVPLQTSALEASPDQKSDTEKEWYYGIKDKEREGPLSFGEVCCVCEGVCMCSLSLKIFILSLLPSIYLQYLISLSPPLRDCLLLISITTLGHTHTCH